MQLDANISPPSVFQLPKTDPEPNAVLPINPNLSDTTQNLYSQGGPSINRPGPYSGMFPSALKSFDVFAIAHWFRNVSSQIFGGKSFEHDKDTKEGRFVGPNVETINKTREWLATNFILAALNPGDIQSYGPGNTVFNPLSLQFAGLVPARGIAAPVERPTAGILTYKDIALLTADTPVERLPLIRKGFYLEASPGHRLSQLRLPIPAGPGYIGPMAGPPNPFGDSLTDENPTRFINPATIEATTNGLTDNAVARMGLHTNLYNEERQYNISNALMPLEKFENEFEKNRKGPPNLDPRFNIKSSALFDAKPFPGGSVPQSYMARPSAQLLDKKGIKVRDIPENVDVDFGSDDAKNGFMNEVQVGTGDAAEDRNYLPFMFEDLRLSNKFLYFRAFLHDGLAETLVPEWNEERYYGRVDPVPVYMGTTRNIDLSFDVVAWQPKDLPVMYKKLEKLQSMVYPLYDEQGFLQAGPIIRMRIGDLFCSDNNQGLPGYITALDFSYDETIWNIKENFKAPRKVTVSLGFTVIHEANPGLYPQGNEIKFGTAQIIKDETKEGKFKLDKFNLATIRKVFKSSRDAN